MEKFKERWEIDRNWQLIFPIAGIFGLFYSGFRLAKTFELESLIITLIIAFIITFTLLRITLFLFKKLENKWVVDKRWEIIRIFIVFALTGSSSVFISRPLIKLFGITKENLNIFLYYLLFIFVSLIVYQLLLVFYGWALGQFKFFWEFEKKMLRKFGLKKFIE